MKRMLFADDDALVVKNGNDFWEVRALKEEYLRQPRN